MEKNSMYMDLLSEFLLYFLRKNYEHTYYSTYRFHVNLAHNICGRLVYKLFFTKFRK